MQSARLSRIEELDGGFIGSFGDGLDEEYRTGLKLFCGREDL